MAGRPIDARGWIFEVEDHAAPDTWLRIGKLKSWNVNPGENEETADTTTFDSEGHYEQDVMQRGATLSLEGLYAATSGTQDPGQAYIDDVWAYRLGEESRGRMRYRHTSQTTWAVWECTVTPGEAGGETNDKTSWAATFTRCGAPTSAAVTVPAGFTTLAATDTQGDKTLAAADTKGGTK
ncbi:phage tail tube protein [Streptomyces sp. CA-250714]|uniref:phage tail tube protein n=1 Tax=Streptomyces sp. CA-250714 TaxID=3240060 RepID=UPI003D8F8622